MSDARPKLSVSDLPTEEDALEFSPYVETLADIVGSPDTETPLTVGVFGDWGSGKTSLLKMIRASLRKPQEGRLRKIQTVWFDAWKYDRQETLWRAFLSRVLAEIRTAIEAEAIGSAVKKADLATLDDLENSLYAAVDREEIGQVRIAGRKFLSGVFKGAVEVGLSFLPSAGLITKLAQGLGDKANEQAADELLASVRRERTQIYVRQVQFLEEFQKTFQRLVDTYVIGRGEGESRLVVFVDDLDRCTPEKAVEVLEAIKLFLDVPGCVFILALAEGVIARGVEIRYRELGADGDTEAGRALLIDGKKYLEKIVQIPFRIPPIAPFVMEKYVAQLHDGWPEIECARVFAVGIAGYPRKVKRAVNAFLLLWKLNNKLGDGIKPILLAKIVVLQHVAPELYEVIQSEPQLLGELEVYYQSEASREGSDLAEAILSVLPARLAARVANRAAREILTMHPAKRTAVDFVELRNFAELKSDEISVYITLTRRTEAPVETPSAKEYGSAEDELEAQEAYRRYLTVECGFITLDGLPADSEIGSRRLALENLFVPLHLDVAGQTRTRQSVGVVLSQHPHLVILATPGSGKSILIKRLAVSYADPAHRALADDDLPPNTWLPLLFRCRELRNHARGSFFELLDELSQREPVRQHAPAFRATVDRALSAGGVLLLVDGLDEISDVGDRAAFVRTLSSAIQAYPKIAMVVTSSDVRFRHVAASLLPTCTVAALSPFDKDDIRSLSISWHREIVGNQKKVREDAEALAVSIAGNDRILRLASNPLLLTTLLLVKRWVGSLPTRRAVLYGKAVEVLLMTWNTEGHEPIPDEEALPQLCYVASTMMLEGVQKLGRPRLAALLREVREILPTELGYVHGTVEDFITRVEDRSSLLMMTGFDVENGQLVEVFEFRHLTFQEFLAARAMVEGWYPGRKPGDTLARVLEPHFDQEIWSEIIPLAAVLGGKQAEELLLRLTAAVKMLTVEESDKTLARPVFLALGNCLADEVSARPETIRAAIQELVRLGVALERAPFAPLLARGRYGLDLREEASRVGRADLL